MKFNQEEFNFFANYHNVIKFKDMVLSSGRRTQFYFSWKSILEDVYLTDKLTDFVIQYTQSQDLMPDTFYGVPEGATKLGILTQDKWARKFLNFGVGSHVLAMRRGKLKNHGDEEDSSFLGKPRGKTILLEDVTTTGNNLIKEIFKLRDETDTDIIATFILTHRMEKRNDGTTVREALEKIGIPLYYLSNAIELLPLAYQKQKPGERIARTIEEEFEKYGEIELKLL
jgi:orotate phosphoribosyltransferase